MVQLIQGFINSLTFSHVAYGGGADNVDPNLVRYFRTEYGRNWKSALDEYLWKENRKLSQSM